MSNIRTTISKGFITFVAFTLLAVTPMTTFADTSSDGCTAPDTSSQAGVHYPTGSDASSFVYQCSGSHIGDWTNDYYLYDPATNSRTPLYSPNYGYNCTSGIWTMDSWDYSAATSKYIYSRVGVSQPVGYANNCPVADSPSAPSGSGSTGSSDGPSALASRQATVNGTTGPGSTNTADFSLANNTHLTNGTTATVNNGITAIATTGSAAVLSNTLGGNASSGNAADEANVINLLQSSSNALGNGKHVTTFTANINGDVNGDLLFDPASLGSLQNASGTTTIDNNLTVNNSVNAQLNNTIDLNANSGSAIVGNNTGGGDATSGSARAVANVMNYINSAITSGDSFIGTININGNLNGDILLPPDLIDQLIASNVPTINVNIPAPNSTNVNNASVNNDVTVNNTNNLGINNIVNSKAASGQADVSNNTGAGNATSGSATTNVTAFNLTGSHVIGQNSILVFVNVLGKWVGLIVNAPAGATAAALGGGITRNTTVSNTADLNNTNNFGINNDISVAARSGDAGVTGNTKGGNAKTGDASTAVNLLNVENSTFDVSHWFGILFINVFGTWHGSFGVNTSAGDPVTPTAQPVAGSPAFDRQAGTAAAAIGALPAQVFRFVPKTSTFVPSNGHNGSITPQNVTTPQAVLAATTIKKAAATSAIQSSNRSFFQPATLIGAAVVLFILADAAISHRRRASH
jgi:hypothetical protein